MKYFIILLILIIPWTASSYTSEETINAIIDSLKTEPDHWKHDAFKLYYFKGDNIKNATGINKWKFDSMSDCILWIANGPRSIEVQKPSKIPFNKEQQNKVWKIYQEWANENVSLRVFKNHMKSKTLKNTEVKPEQNIKEEPTQLLSDVGEDKPTPTQLLSDVGGDKPKPVENNNPCAFWQLIATVEFLILLVGLGMVGYHSMKK
jgi:hypothetical protein